MMGLWEPETCRVKIKEINTQNEQLHLLVTLLQYVQKFFHEISLQWTLGILLHFCFVQLQPCLFNLQLYDQLVHLELLHPEIYATMFSFSFKTPFT